VQKYTYNFKIDQVDLVSVYLSVDFYMSFTLVFNKLFPVSKKSR